MRDQNYPSANLWTRVEIEADPQPEMTQYCRVKDHVTLFPATFTREQIARWGERELIGLDNQRAISS